MKVLVINPGATSTKISVFEESEEIRKANIAHSAEDLMPFAKVVDQKEYRLGLISNTLSEMGFELSDFSAICARGGLLRHIPSGTYRVTDKVIADATNAPFGEHASNLGVILAKELGDRVGIPAFFVDPVSVDEMQDLARFSGYKGFERQSFFHALNHKGMARRAAAQLGKAYEEVNLIVTHLGGGVSTAAHMKGRVVDVYNVKDDGAFSVDRGGALPTNALINYCFSGKTKEEVKKEFASCAGVFSYLGTRDFLDVELKAIAGDEECAKVFDAFIYQQCKDIGAMATVMCMDVDAIVLTGGMAYSKKLVADFEARVGKIAPIIVLPGEAEMRSLAEGAFRVLHGGEASEY